MARYRLSSSKEHFHPAPFTNETVVLSADFGARMLWWLTPDETAQLPQGICTITATLNTTNITLPDAWRGLIEGAPVHLTITNEPGILSAAQMEQKHRLLADYALLFGDRTRARAEIALDQVALQTPDAEEPPMELLLKWNQLEEVLSLPVLEHELLNQQIVPGWSGHPASTTGSRPPWIYMNGPCSPPISTCLATGTPPR